MLEGKGFTQCLAYSNAQHIFVEILYRFLFGSAKSHLLSVYHEQMPGIGMWENQEPSEHSWIQNSPWWELWMKGNVGEEGIWGNLKRNNFINLPNEILLNSWFWLRKLKTICLHKYYGRYFIFSIFGDA